MCFCLFLSLFVFLWAVLPEINDLMMILPMSAVVYIAGIFFGDKSKSPCGVQGKSTVRG